MQPALILSPQNHVAGRLENAVKSLDRLRIKRIVDHYPDPEEFSKLLRATAPVVVFIHNSEPQRIAGLVQQLEREAPGVGVIAFGCERSPSVILELMRVGVREFLSEPFPSANVQQAIDRTMAKILSNPPKFMLTPHVYCFLPAKAGSGATTIALNASFALASALQGRVLLIELDLCSGQLKFALKLVAGPSVTDAAEWATELDDQMWAQLVRRVHGIDVLCAGELKPNTRLDAAQIRALLEYARRNYEAVCLDLSTNLEQYALESMRDSEKVFLVCTPELPSLHLARQKAAVIRDIDQTIPIALLMNRFDKRSGLNPDAIKASIGLRPFAIFRNDYESVQQAIESGRAVDNRTELAREFEAFAASLVAPNGAVPPEPKQNVLSKLLSLSRSLV